MTKREVVSAIVKIRRRRGEEMKFQAALRGIKFDLGPLEESVADAEKFTEKEDALAERAMQHAIERKQRQSQGQNV